MSTLSNIIPIVGIKLYSSHINDPCIRKALLIQYLEPERHHEIDDILMSEFPVVTRGIVESNLELKLGAYNNIQMVDDEPVNKYSIEFVINTTPQTSRAVIIAIGDGICDALKRKEDIPENQKFNEFIDELNITDEIIWRYVNSISRMREEN